MATNINHPKFFIDHLREDPKLRKWYQEVIGRNIDGTPYVPPIAQEISITDFQELTLADFEEVK